MAHWTPGIVNRQNRYRICQSINREKSLTDLIDIDSFDQSAEIDDTLVSFIDLS